MRSIVIVRAAWDDEAKVWYVEDSDVPGLATEADTVDELRQKVLVRIDDLLEDAPDRPGELAVGLIAIAHDRLVLSRAA
jgi:predicted RNase H-like HicB family nuclease